MSASARRLLVRAGLGLGVAALLVERGHAFLGGAPTDFDDAYMFARYAHNLLAGHGLAWNPGGATYGATGLVHLGIVTALRALAPHAGDAAVLRGASAGAALALLVGLGAACARFCTHPRLRGAFLPWTIALILLCGYAEPFVFHARTGMDTMSSALGQLGLLWATLHLAERPGRRAALVAALAGYLAIAARPDNAAAAFLCPVLAIALVCPPPRRAILLSFAVALGALVAADLALKARFLGTPLPLSFYVKLPGAYGGFVGEYTWNPFLFLEVFLAGALPFVVALVVLAGARSARLLAVLLVPPALTAVAYFSMNQIMGHLGRFYFPALPFVVAGAALALDRSLASLAGAPLAPRVLVRLAVAVLAVPAGGAALEAAGRRWEARTGTQSLATLGGYETAAKAPLPEMDSWRAAEEIGALAAGAPPGTRFAMSEHGLPGALAPRAIIDDVLGLHDRFFALHGFSAAELFRRQPDAIWMPHPDHTQMIRDILDSDEFWRDYVFYPDAFMYGLALRRPGPRFADLDRALRARWAAVYPGCRPEAYVAHRSRR